jgi:hypothetical protein
MVNYAGFRWVKRSESNRGRRVLGVSDAGGDRRNFGVGLLMQNPGDYFSLPSSQSALFELPRILENVL